MTRKNRKENELVRKLKENTTLDKETRLQAVSLAELYSTDLLNNVMLSAFELDHKYQTHSIDGWLDFFGLPAVKSYKAKIINSLADNRASDILISGDKPRDAIAIREDLMARENADNNQKFVIFRMQPKVRFKGDE